MRRCVAVSRGSGVITTYVCIHEYAVFTVVFSGGRDTVLIRRSEVESDIRVRGRLLRGSVGRSVGGSDPGRRRRDGAGESVGRVTRVGSRAVAGGREGRSVGLPVSLLSGRRGSVGRENTSRLLNTLRSRAHVSLKKKKRFSYSSTPRAPPLRAGGSKWVGRSGGPSRDGRRRRQPGGSVGRASRPKICFAALRAAGRSVERTESGSQQPEKAGRSAGTFSLLKTSRRPVAIYNTSYLFSLMVSNRR